MGSRNRGRSYPVLAGASALLVVTLAMVWDANPAHAQAACCNTVTCQTVVPPDPPFAGPVFFNLQSSCTAKVCGGSITLSPATTTSSKCEALVMAINANCAGAGFQVLASGDNCANSSTFTVTDTGCNCGPAGAGKGLTLLLSNSGATGTFITSGFLPDYEDDIITTCGGATNPSGGSLGNLGGTATGSAIVGGTSASVSFDVFTEKGFHVEETVPTGMGDSPSKVLQTAHSLLNQGLAGAGSQGNCSIDESNPVTMRCALRGSGTSKQQDLPLAIQLNDTGFVRLQGSGPSEDIIKVQAAINRNGGISNLQTFSAVVAAGTVPAAPPWAVAGLALLLLATGGLFFASGRRRTKST